MFVNLWTEYISTTTIHIVHHITHRYTGNENASYYQYKTVIFRDINIDVINE